MARYEFAQLEDGHPAGTTKTFDRIEDAVSHLRSWATYFIADGYEDMVESIAVCGATIPFEQTVAYSGKNETCARVENLITKDTSKVIIRRTDGRWRSAEISISR